MTSPKEKLTTARFIISEAILKWDRKEMLGSLADIDLARRELYEASVDINRERNTTKDESACNGKE